MKKIYNLTKLLMLAVVLFGSLLPVSAQTIQLGTGTAVNGTTASSPVNIWYRRTVSQFVYTAAELNAAGIVGPCSLQDIGWFVTQSPLYNIPGYTVKVKHVAANNVAAALGTGGWTTVKNSFTYSPTAGGWDMLGLDNAFAWNGVDNIGVELCWSQVTPSYNGSGQCRLYSTPSGYRYSWTDATGSSCGLTPATTNTNKPQVQMVWGNCGPPCSTPNPPSANGVTTSCGNGVTLSASGTPPGGTYNWYSDAAGTTLVGTGASYTTPPLYSSATFYVGAFVSPNCESTLVPVSVNVTSNVTPPTAANVSVNCGNSATVSASGGTNYIWYGDANGANNIGTGNTLSLGTLYADSTVYVANSASSGSPTTLYSQDWQSGQTGWTEQNSGPYWNLLSGQTGSVNTGPAGGSANGTPTAGNNYMYLETSTGAGTSYLIGPGFTVTGQATFEFDYHMFGASMGTLAVEAWNGSTWTEVWSISGQQQTSLGAAWTTISIPLTGYYGVINLRFRGLRGSSFTSDMAVDNLLLTEVVPGCQSNLVAVTATVVPPTAIPVTGVTQICSSNTTTLSASGTSVEWYSDAGGTNVVGTGNSFTTPPLVANTTYYVGENNVGPSGTYDQTIIVQGGSGLGASNAFNFPGTPTGAVGTPSLTITTYGDIDGTGTNLEQWRVDDETGALAGTAGGTGNFADQCGTTITTVVPLTTAQIDAWAANGSIDFTGVDPTGNINYTLCGGDYLQLQLTYTYNTTNPCPAPLAQVDITVDQPSSAPASVSGGGSICLGTTATLAVQGGTLVGSSNWEWFSNNCGGTPIGTGPSISVTPSTTTTYFVAASANGACPATACANGTVSLPVPSNNLSGDGETATCTVNQGGYIHLLTPAGDLVASINSNGQNLGTVTATSYLETTPLLIDNCNNIGNPNFQVSVNNRHWVITSAIAPSAPVEVLLPTTEAEWQLMGTEAFANGNINDDITNGLADVGCTKYSGPNENANFPDNCGQGGAFTWHSQTSNGNINAMAGLTGHAATDKYITVDVNSFSEFWLHGSSTSSPLPVELVDFSSRCIDGDVAIEWSTASENNSMHFEVESSVDAFNWEAIAVVDAAQFSTSLIDYAILHEGAAREKNYYRLKQVDTDGAYEYYSIIYSDCGSDFDGAPIIFPNPSKNNFTIDFGGSGMKGIVQLTLVSMEGKEVSNRQLNLSEGVSTFQINNLELRPGLYLIKMIDMTGKLFIIKHRFN